jgi:signal transduction histidine kinase
MTHVRVDLDFDAFSRFVSDGIAYIAVDGTVAAWSHGAAAVTGIASPDAFGRSLDELFALVEPALGFSALPEPLQLCTADEHRRVLHATVLSVDDGWLISFGPQQRFAAIDQLKNELVAAVSHELKTPIATIKAYARTMRMNPSTIERDGLEFLTTIEEQADRLASAVEDILRVGRVNPLHLLERRDRVTLDDILERVSERIAPTAVSRIERRGTTVAFSCDPELTAEALARVIDNALKFSSDVAPIAVEASATETGVVLHVRDRGIGIAAEHLPYIFERFYRVERNLTSTTAGTGLGLAIVRDIVHAHGGTVEVRSVPREGTTFTLHFPDRGPSRASA